MAYTEFGTNDAQTVKLWSKVLFLESILQTNIAKMMGTGEGAIIQRLPDLEKNAGDQIKFDLLLQMQGYGVDGDERLRGKGEALRFTQDSILINQKRLAHEFKAMTQQRTVHNLRENARTNLKDRWSVILDKFGFAYLSGIAYSDDADLLAALPFAGNSLRTPDANHVIDQTSATFALAMIDYAKERARIITPPLRPAMVDGRQMSVIWLTPFQETNLKRSQEWRELQRDAGPKGSTNQLFTGALGQYNDCIIHSSSYMPTKFVSVGSASNRSHALYLGAQAGVIAFGNAVPNTRRASLGGGAFLNWAEEVDDYGNEQGVAAGMVFGLSKSQFSIGGTNTDYGVIRIDTKDGRSI